MLTTMVARFMDDLGKRSVERTWIDHVACGALCKVTAPAAQVCRNALASSVRLILSAAAMLTSVDLEPR